MNRRLLQPPSAERFTFQYNGETVEGVKGDTIASALLAAGVDVFSRSIKYHRPRGAWCLSGRCSHCLVRVDGVPDVQACTTPVTPMMEVSAQNAYPSAKHDVLAAIDWMFPKGLDHHSMFTGVPLVEGAVSTVARHIAGIGPLPARVALPDAPNEHARCDVAIVGAGPAGLACALALRGSGLTVEVLEDRPVVGGRLQGLPGVPPDPDVAWAEQARQDCEQAGIKVRTRATVLACYREEKHPLLAVQLCEPERLLMLEAPRVVFCNGAVDALEPFENNDMPGIYAGRGLARLIKLQRVLPGRVAVVAGTGPEALALARLLAASGAKVAALADPSGKLAASEFRVLAGFSPKHAVGRNRLSAIELAGPNGQVEHVDCDLLALCGTPTPAFELPRQAGARIGWRRESGGYFVEAGANGATCADGIFAAGDVTGAVGAARARELGEALGRALATTRS